MRSVNGGRAGVAFVLAVQAVLAVGVLVFVATNTQLRLPLFDGDPYVLVAEFTDAGGLSATNRPAVLVAGVPSGRVVDVDYRGGTARVRMRLEDDMRGKVHADATARVTGRSAINDLLVDITPGTSVKPPLESGGVIGSRRTSGPVGSDRVVDVLDADTRAHLTVMLTQLRQGLDGRSGDLARALGALDVFAQSASRVTGALADRRRLLRRLVDQSSLTFDALGDRGAEIRDVIQAGRAVLDTAGAADPKLRAAVRALPRALSALDGALVGINALARPLTPALADLRPVARDLPGALRATRGTLPVADRLLTSLDALGRDGGPGARDLRRALEALRPSASALTPGLRRLRPALEALADVGNGIGEFGQNFSGVFSTNDANGPVLRGLGFSEPFNPEDFGLPAARGRALEDAKLAAAGALIGACLRVNPAACLFGEQVRGLAPTVRKLTRSIRGADRPPLAALTQALRHRGVR